MLEVCQYNGRVSAMADPISNGIVMVNEDMKHASSNVEVFEFNLGQAHQLRCVNRTKATTCGECEACVLNNKLTDIREWFPKMGDNSKKRLMLGLLRRFHSTDLLQQLVTLLHPMLCKDYTYSRSRTCPSLSTDSSTLSADRALNDGTVEGNIISYWKWFEKTNYWTKSNFAFAVLQLCDSHLLHTLASQARTLLITEEKAASGLEDDDHLESSSISGTEYSYKTDDHPELDMLISLSPEYCTPKRDPITGKRIRPTTRTSTNGGQDFPDESSLSSLDPALMVIPTSAKAYSGVSHYRDFIRYLPVHLAKYILRLLDEASLHAAKDVCTKWQVLVSEVKIECELNKKLMEEVMLMQGASAQGVNHEYAKDIDVLVPNLYPGTNEVIKTKGEVTYNPDYKTMMNFDVGYSGISTRKAIIEERNVFCGSYYVQIMLKVDDPHRVFHTDGGNIIVTGSKDRKIRFIEMENRSELDLKISGHAGSIKCVHLNTEDKYVLSGSYDTSIRKWSIVDGKCQKIFRGHRDTVLCMEVLNDILCSGSKDGACKIWNLHTGKCRLNLRHKSAATAVALSKDLEVVIVGCDDGVVKVWDLKSGELIKILKGHDDTITAIQFDKWHIVTGSKDSYAHVYSSQGNHDRILNALKHPQAVLCLAFMYLRVITGSKDGRLRIWNMVSGQCCRIMRGNSQSDPIRSIVAIGDRITLNTDKNLLVLSFDPPNWDYTLETDKVPSLVPYSSYSDAPLRHREYSYIRANRMQKAGASNTKIIHHDHRLKRSETFSEGFPQHRFRAPQLPHSAKSLSKRSMHSAKMIQTYAESGYESGASPTGMESRMASSVVSSKKSMASAPLHPPFPKARPTTKSEHSVVIATEKQDDEEDEETELHPLTIQRRVSWAFDKPLIPKSKEISLSETKAILRSQIRMKAESIVPPDFIYLTVNAIQSSMQPSETSNNTQKNIRDMSVRLKEIIKRPSSSPSKIDPRTKLPLDELGLEKLVPKTEEVDTKSVSEFSETKSFKSSKKGKEGLPSHGPDKEVYATQCDVIPTKVRVRTSLHPKTTKKTVPMGRVIRPVSASASRRHPPPEEEKNRPITAPSLRRPGTCVSVPSTIVAAMPGASPPKKPEGISSTSYESNIVPMCMYPPNMKEKLAQLLKEKRQALGHEIDRSRSDSSLCGRVGQFSDPLRSHVKFELRTYEQEKDFVDSIEKNNFQKQQREEVELEKRRRAAWLAKAKSNLKERPKTVS